MRVKVPISCGCKSAVLIDLDQHLGVAGPIDGQEWNPNPTNILTARNAVDRCTFVTPFVGGPNAPANVKYAW